MRVLMLFLDGVGLGEPDASINPFFAAHLPVLRSLLGGQLPSLRTPAISTKSATLLPLDATLGVGGLPQSGTGQTALFTGVNAAELIGKHFGPHPYSSLWPVIQEKNIFKRILALGVRPCFANAFPQKFFDYVSRHRTRMTVTTLSCTMSGVPLLKAEDLRQGLGVSADITSAGWKDLGYPDMPVVETSEAGRRLVELSSQYEFVLFEYWKTDHAGHSGRVAEAIEVLERLDGMLAGIIEALDSSSTLLFMTSDHGNVEDISVKTHTRNPVPAILFGRGHDTFADTLHRTPRNGADLTRVMPALMEHITMQN